MTAAVSHPPSTQKRLVAAATLRGALTAAVLVALYYVMPLNSVAGASALARIVLGFLVFLGLMVWQVRAISASRNPGLRALEAALLVVPLFLLLFASTYFLMSQADETSFTAPLSRTDALYFTVTIFSTVGFGDISARAQSARLVVSAQMLLDLVVLGLGVRILLNAVQRGRDRLTSDSGDV